MKKKILAIVASATVLFGCYGPPTGQVSPSGNSYTATYSKQYQIDAELQSGQNFTTIWIRYRCHGETLYKDGAITSVYTAPTSDGDTVKITVYCASGIADASPMP